MHTSSMLAQSSVGACAFPGFARFIVVALPEVVDGVWTLCVCVCVCVCVYIEVRVCVLTCLLVSL